jgi:transposase-like protein
MDAKFDTVAAILAQVESTQISINRHAEGHFVSSSQLRALREALGIQPTPTPTTSPSPRSRTAAETSLIQAIDLKRQELLLEFDSNKRAALNLQKQQLESRLAAVRRSTPV